MTVQLWITLYLYLEFLVKVKGAFMVPFPVNLDNLWSEALLVSS